MTNNTYVKISDVEDMESAETKYKEEKTQEGKQLWEEIHLKVATFLKNCRQLEVNLIEERKKLLQQYVKVNKDVDEIVTVYGDLYVSLLSSFIM